ncbi:MAG: DUF4215 domain-containing protein [Candidatus Peregrinibacteria bacterium]
MFHFNRSLIVLGISAMLASYVPSGTFAQVTNTQGPIRFDFGIAGSPVETGYTAVIPQDIYTAARGYGWISRVTGADHNDPKMSALLRDLAYARDATFKVNLDPSKTYDIRIYHANPRHNGSISYVEGIYRGNPSSSSNTGYFADNFNVSAEGTVRYTVSIIPAGGTIIRTIPNVAISKDGILELRFRDLGGRDNNFVVSGLEIAVAPPVCGNGKVESPEQCDDGNKRNNDGCSATCKVEAVQNELTIAVKPLAFTGTAVANQKNINLLWFETRAEVQDVLFTGATFDAAEGSLLNASNYTLWVDTDGNGVVDTILQSGAFAQNGKVNFGLLAGRGYVIPKERTTVFEVHGDVVSSLQPQTTIQLKFATNQSDYVRAKAVKSGDDLVGIKTDGVCTGTCQITVTTGDSTVWTFIPAGNLHAIENAVPIRPRQLLGGALGDPVLSFDLRAEYEPVDFTRLTLATAREVESIDRFELFKPGSSAPFALATAAACPFSQPASIRYCAVMMSQQLVVPEGQTTSIIVRPRIKDDVAGARSGAVFFVYLIGAGIVDGNGNDVGSQARGMVSSNALRSDNGNGNTQEGEMLFEDIRSADETVVLSKIVSITNADPNPNGTAIPTGPARAIGQFKFAAAANNNAKNGVNKVAIDGLIFNVSAQNVAILGSSFNLYNKADPTTVAACIFKGASVPTMTGSVTGNMFVECSDLLASGVNTLVDSGTDETYVLSATVTNANISSASTSALQVSLQNFADSGLADYGAASFASHLKWNDQDSLSSSTFLWIEYPDTQVNGTAYAG